jgi:hypothetical protein
LFFHGQCQSFHQLTFSLTSYLLIKSLINDIHPALAYGQYLKAILAPKNRAGC